MLKKSVKKKSKTKRKSPAKRKKQAPKPKKRQITQTSSEVKVERILIENFVSLQKVMVNVSMKMDTLANKISKLLEVFELSAKALADKEFEFDKGGLADENTKKILEKMDTLLDQNKTIARGVMLVHEKNEEPSFEPYKKHMPSITPPTPPKGFASPHKQVQDKEKYQKSISSEPANFEEFP